MDRAITTKHHDQNASTQKTFLEKVRALQRVLREMGNPFQEETADLLVLDTKTIADQTLTGLVATHQERGKQQFVSFVADVGGDDTCSFYQPIKKNKVTLFKHEKVASSSREQVIKEECQLFSRLFISCKVRRCNLEDFFKHENQAALASLSDNGKLHVSQKSQLMEILQSRRSLPEREPEGDTIIIDGSAFINATPPRSSKSFDDYAKEDILPRVKFYATKYKRVNVVFNVYKKSSLKMETREKRGQGIRRVTATNKTPPNWKNFL